MRQGGGEIQSYSHTHKGIHFQFESRKLQALYTHSTAGYGAGKLDNGNIFTGYPRAGPALGWNSAIAGLGGDCLNDSREGHILDS